MFRRHSSGVAAAIGWLAVIVCTAPATAASEARGDGEISLPAALALALTHSPRLAEYSWEIRARAADVVQAGLPLNPQIDIELENFAGSGAADGLDGSEATVLLSQRIELGGKRRKRVAVASLKRDLASRDYEISRLAVIESTTQAYLEVLALQEHLELADQDVALAREVVDTVRTRVRAGSSSVAERTRAEIALATAEIERERMVAALAVARQTLAASWGDSEPRFEAVTGSLAATFEIPSLAELRERLASSPELARYDTKIAERAKEVELARGNATPDVTIGAGYRRLAESDDDAVVAEISVPLPLFDRNQGKSLAASHRLEQTHAQRRAAEARLVTELSAAYAMLVAVYGRITRMEATVLPGAASAFEALRAGYREGRFRYLDVLDAQRTLTTARSQHVDALADLHRQWAVLDRLTGGSLTVLGNSGVLEPAEGAL